MSASLPTTYGLYNSKCETMWLRTDIYNRCTGKILSGSCFVARCLLKDRA